MNNNARCKWKNVHIQGCISITIQYVYAMGLFVHYKLYFLYKIHNTSQ